MTIGGKGDHFQADGSVEAKSKNVREIEIGKADATEVSRGDVSSSWVGRSLVVGQCLNLILKRPELWSYILTRLPVQAVSVMQSIES